MKTTNKLFFSTLLSGAPTKHIAKTLNERGFCIDTFGFGEVTPEGWYQEWNNSTQSLDGYNQIPVITRWDVENRMDFHYTSQITNEVVKNLIANKDELLYFDGSCYEPLEL